MERNTYSPPPGEYRPSVDSIDDQFREALHSAPVVSKNCKSEFIHDDSKDSLYRKCSDREQSAVSLLSAGRHSVDYEFREAFYKDKTMFDKKKEDSSRKNEENADNGDNDDGDGDDKNDEIDVIVMPRSTTSSSVSPRSISSLSSTDVRRFSSLDEETQNKLALNLAAAPRPNLPRESVGMDAAYLASLALQSNPSLRGAELLKTLAECEKEAQILNDKARGIRRRAGVDAHHSITGGTVKNGWVEKKSGGRYFSNEMTMGGFQRRWFVLKDSCLVYYGSEIDTKPYDAIIFDRMSDVVTVGGDSCEFEVLNSSRCLTLKVGSKNERESWCTAIANTLKLCEFTKQHPFGSFAPMRGSMSIAPLINGKEYFAAVARALESAHDEIFIAGWWVHPDLLMRRGCGSGGGNGHENTLRSILAETVKKNNVKVYILLYKEQSIAMPNNSIFAEEELKSIAPSNVFVQVRAIITSKSDTNCAALNSKLTRCVETPPCI